MTPKRRILFGRKPPVTIGQTIAQNHHTRVIAASGFMPVTAAELATLLDLICTAYGITTEAQFITQFPTFKDEHWTGYRLGAGAGATLGRAAHTVFSINPAADAVQTTAAAQPLLLAWNGQNYWWGSGVAGNFISTPNAAANQITGDIDLIAYSSFVNGIENTALIAKYGASTATRHYLFASEGLRITLYINVGGSLTSNQSTVNNPLIGSQGWVRVTRNSTTGEIIFYTSTNSPTTSIGSITWTQLGANISGTAGSLTTSTEPLTIGAFGATGIAYNKFGIIQRATISNTIGGAPVVDFNPQLYNAAVSQTTISSATGETYTINTGAAVTGYKGVLVDRTKIQSDGIDDNLLTSNLTISQPMTVYSAYTTHTSASSSSRYSFDTDIRADHNSPTMSIRINAGTSYSSGILPVVNNLSIVTETLNAANTTVQQNNGAAATGNAGTNNAINKPLGLFRSGATINGNITFNTFVITASNDTTAQRLAMFNVIRTMNRL